MRWQRIAVAAAFIGAAVLLWTITPREENKSSFTAELGTGTEKNKTVASHDALPMNTVGTQVAKKNGGITAADRSAAEPSAISRDMNNPARNMYATSSVITAEQLANEDRKNNDLIAKADPVTTMQRNSFETVSSNTSRVSGDNPVMETMDQERLHTAEENQVKYASLTEESKPVVYRELDTESADERKSLLLGSVEINKDKLRGFFRKAGSIFRSKGGNTEEENTTAVPATRSLK